MKHSLAITIFSLSLSTAALAAQPSGRDSTFGHGHSYGPPDNYNDFPNVALGIGFGQGGQAVSSSGIVMENSFPEKITLRNTPDPYAPTINATGNCLGSVSGGVTLVGFGGSLGKSYEAVECQRGEWFRLFLQAGDRQTAMEIACQSPIVRQTTLCR